MKRIALALGIVALNLVRQFVKSVLNLIFGQQDFVEVGPHDVTLAQAARPAKQKLDAPASAAYGARC